MLKEGMPGLVSRSVAGLWPGYFAMVMSTGIVSLAAYLLNLMFVAWILFGLNVVFYVLLGVLTIARLIWFFPLAMADLRDYRRGPGFLTVVAGTAILGSQFEVLAKNSNLALTLWFLCFFLWLILNYTFLTMAILRDEELSLPTGIHGGWLILVVAVEAVAVLGTLVILRFGAWQDALVLLVLTLHLLGCLLYLVIISLIFQRFFFFALTPQELMPSYWVNMGAAAITALAGANLILGAASVSGFVPQILPFLMGNTLLFWGVATWWIPLLVILGWWRHVYRHYPLAYDPTYWMLVFPLGMYTVATIRTAAAMGFDFLFIVPRVFVYIALLAWAITFGGLVYRIISELRKALAPPAKSPPASPPQA